MIAGLATAPLHELRRLAGSLSPEGIDDEVELVALISLLAGAGGRSRRNSRMPGPKLREALHARTRFIASVSHELKTPIAVLLTEDQTLDARTLTQETASSCRASPRRCGRLGRMVESFLTLHQGARRDDSGGTEDPRQSTNLVMEAVAELRQDRAPIRRFLSRRPGRGRFPARGLRGCRAPARHDRQPDPTTHPFQPERQRVLIRVVAGFEQCTVTVRDFGPGVPEDLKDKLFERFVQGPGRQTAGRGHGLGLSIAQGIAELHGGPDFDSECARWGVRVCGVLRAPWIRRCRPPPSDYDSPRPPHHGTEKRGTHPQNEGSSQPPLAGPHEARPDNMRRAMCTRQRDGSLNCYWPDVP